jgi:hypothetical protein
MLDAAVYLVWQLLFCGCHGRTEPSSKLSVTRRAIHRTIRHVGCRAKSRAHVERSTEHAFERSAEAIRASRRAAAGYASSDPPNDPSRGLLGKQLGTRPATTEHAVERSAEGIRTSRRANSRVRRRTESPRHLFVCLPNHPSARYPSARWLCAVRLPSCLSARRAILPHATRPPAHCAHSVCRAVRPFAEPTFRLPSRPSARRAVRPLTECRPLAEPSFRSPSYPSARRAILSHATRPTPGCAPSVRSPHPSTRQAVYPPAPCPPARCAPSARRAVCPFTEPSFHSPSRPSARYPSARWLHAVRSSSHPSARRAVRPFAEPSFRSLSRPSVR